LYKPFFILNPFQYKTIPTILYCRINKTHLKYEIINRLPFAAVFKAPL